MALKTYSITDFPGANFNADMTSAGFRVPNRVLNVDFVSGTGITPRPSFRTHVTAGGSYWYTWCQSIHRYASHISSGYQTNTSISNRAGLYGPIFLRTPQSGSTNLFAVDHYSGATIGSATIGGTDAAAYGNLVFAQISGGLSITDIPITAFGRIYIATPTGELCRYSMGGGMFTALASPGYGSYAGPATYPASTYSAYVAILPQSRRLLLAQGGRVWFSDPDSETFTSPNYFTLNSGTSGMSVVTGLATVGESVYILTNSGIYIIYGETTDSNGNALMQYRRISDEGCPIPYYGFTKGENGTVYFYNNRGLHALRGVSVTDIPTPIDYTKEPSIYAPYGAHSNRDVLSVNATGKDLHYFPSVDYSMGEYTSGTNYEFPLSWVGVSQIGRKLFLYGKSPDLGGATNTSITTTKGGCWVLDLPTNKWAYWDISPNCMTGGYEQLSTTANYYESRSAGRYRYYFASSGAGYTNWSAKTLNRSDPLQSADTPANINVEYFTGYENFGRPGVEKRFESFRVHGAATSAVTIDTFPDWQPTAQYLGARASFNVGDYSLAGPTRGGFKIFQINLQADKLAFRIYRNSSQQLWHIGQLDVFYDDGISASTMTGGLTYSNY